MKSLSEIETTVKRASKAAGFSWGIAEEVGKSIRLLELFGLPGIKNLNQYYEDKKVKKFESLNLIRENNLSSSNSFCPIILGVSFLDQIKKMEVLKKNSIYQYILSNHIFVIFEQIVRNNWEKNLYKI